MPEGDETSSHGATEHEEATIGDEPSVSAESERGVAGSITEPPMIPEARQQRLEQIEEEQASLRAEEDSHFQQVLDTHIQFIRPLAPQDKANYLPLFTRLAELHYSETLWSDISKLSQASTHATNLEEMIRRLDAILLDASQQREIGGDEGKRELVDILNTTVDQAGLGEELAGIYGQLSKNYSKYIELEEEKKAAEGTADEVIIGEAETENDPVEKGAEGDSTPASHPTAATVSKEGPIKQAPEEPVTLDDGTTYLLKPENFGKIGASYFLSLPAGKKYTISRKAPDGELEITFRVGPDGSIDENLIEKMKKTPVGLITYAYGKGYQTDVRTKNPNGLTITVSSPTSNALGQNTSVSIV